MVPRPAAASLGDELRKGLVSCALVVESVSCSCFRDQSGFVAGAVDGDDTFVAGPREGVLEIGSLLKERWEHRDQLIGPGSDDQKELHVLNRTLRWCRDGLVFLLRM